MQGKVRGRYPEVGPFVFPLNIRLLPNLPNPAEYKAKREYRQHSYHFKHKRHHRCVLSE